MADGLNQMGAWRGKLQPAGRSLILATLSPTLGCRAWRHISGYGACRDAWYAVYTQFCLMNETALPSWSLPSVISWLIRQFSPKTESMYQGYLPTSSQKFLKAQRSWDPAQRPCSDCDCIPRNNTSGTCERSSIFRRHLIEPGTTCNCHAAFLWKVLGLGRVGTPGGLQHHIKLESNKKGLLV